VRKQWLFKGDDINMELASGVAVLSGRGQFSENFLETTEDFCRGTLLLDWKVGTGRQSYKVLM